MIHKKLLLVVTAAVLMWASEAHANAILTIGNNPQLDENVLFNTDYDGNPIFGVTNQSGLPVRFTGDELLAAPSSGQARIEADAGAFTYLMIDVPNGSFSSLILNPHATLDGTVDFTATMNTGVEVFNNIAVDGNGQNFFTFTTLNGQRFLSIAFQADGALEFENAAQFRIGDAQVNSTVPDAVSTMSLLGLGFAGIAVARRRLSRG